MTRLPLTALLFLSSYSPMFVLIGIRSWEDSRSVSYASAALAVAGIAGVVVFLRSTRTMAKMQVRIVQIERRDADVAAYAATYLLPFMTVFTGKAADVLSLAGFIAVLGIIYARSRLIYINPLLALFGYELFRVLARGRHAAPDPDAVGWPKYLLARKASLDPGDVVDVRSPADDLYLYVAHAEPDEQEDLFDKDT